MKSPSTEYLPFPGKARLETDSRSTQAARIVDEGIQSQPPAIISTPSPAYTSLIEKADVFEPAIDKDKDNSDPAVAAIIEENKALKNTLNEFDAEFFEQLEDLKYRYARLQEIVGQSPAPTGSIISDERKENVSDVPAAYRKSALPLDKLAWSARSSVNAMDRASYNSPLVSNPRPPDYYRTLPKHNTAKLSLNSPSHDDLQLPWKDSSSSFQRDTRTLTAPSLVGYPSELSDMRGGVKPHSTSFTVANDAVGNFAHFCERRLAFELTSHPSPEQAMQSLIHR